MTGQTKVIVDVYRAPWSLVVLNVEDIECVASMFDVEELMNGESKTLIKLEFYHDKPIGPLDDPVINTKVVYLESGQPIFKRAKWVEGQGNNSNLRSKTPSKKWKTNGSLHMEKTRL